MKTKWLYLMASLHAIACSTSTHHLPTAERWVTYADKTKLLSKQPNIPFSSVAKTASIIQIDTGITYQTIDGFGYTLTGGSAQLIQQKISDKNREALLKELFHASGMGISYLRISIGSSDLDEKVFSYDDLPNGQSDEDLEHFSLKPDRLYLVPTLQQILQINPSIKLMASPWSAPAWMKNNQSPKGGSLLPRYYDSYANYFVKYLQGMKAEGITIDAITIQNEPEHPGNLPSMTMTSNEQLEFIKSHLGPAFKTHQITTKIIIYDHNCDHPEYPLAILSDKAAKKYIDGTAFHLYLGDVNALKKVHELHPDKNIYFTEQWTSGHGDFGVDLAWHVKNLIIGAMRNWSRTVLEWNVASDENYNPHTPQGGCTLCQGAITINSATGKIERNVSYFIIAQAAKFLPPGSIRIFSSEVAELPNVAFITPEQKKVLIVLNDSADEKKIAIKYNGSFLNMSLPAKGVASIVF
ncbi:MAG: glycoside hydrolase family 30 protein [Flammeovirgaceae bacterium]